MRTCTFSLSLAAIFTTMAVPSFAETNYREFDLNSFKLGMKKEVYMPLIKETCIYNRNGFTALRTYDVGETKINGARRFVCRASLDEEIDIFTSDGFGIMQIIRSKKIPLPENLPDNEKYNNLLAIRDKISEKYGAPTISKTAAPDSYFFANVGKNTFPWNVNSSHAKAVSCWGDCSDSETDTDGVINLKGSGAMAVLVPYPQSIYLYQILIDRAAIEKTEAEFTRKEQEAQDAQEKKAVEDAKRSVENIKL